MDIQTDFRAITDWFLENYIILYSEKCHYMCIRKKIIQNGKKFKNSKGETILGVTTENKTNF